MLFNIILLFLSISVCAYLVYSKIKHHAQIKMIMKNEDDRLATIRSELESSKTKAIQSMIDEIVSLMDVQKEKTRMEKELETAKYVQDYMLHGKQYKDSKLQLGVYHVSSSECSGDWWYYGQIAGQFYVMLGDATGHGVPAALLTATVRSALSIIETYDTMSPAMVLKILNRCVYQASKGHMNMTFFVLAFDSKNMKITYANASHEPAILWRKGAEAQVLMGATGCRLGDEVEMNFTEESLDILSGDRLVIYTDGVYEYVDEKKRSLSEMGFMKLLKNLNESKDQNSLPQIHFSETLESRGYRLQKLDRRNVDDVAVIFLDLI